MNTRRAVTAGALVTVLLSGCASGPPASTPSAAPGSGSGGIVLREHDKVGRVWTAEGASLKGYDALVLTETRGEVPKLNPDGRENLDWARGVVREELVRALAERKAFGEVVAGAPPAFGRTLVLETVVVDYEKGGGAARYWAGLYGAGQPVIRVRGTIRDGERPLVVFEGRRSGVGGKARWLGAYVSDKDIQTNDIRDLAGAVADFVAELAKR